MIRYVFVTCSGGHFPRLIRQEVERPGSYSWHKAFQNYPGASGEIKHVDEIANTDFQRFSIVHMNLSGVSTKYFKPIREQLKGSSTKFIMNLDYAPECIDIPEWVLNAREFYETFKQVDFIFAQVPGQVALLNMIWQRMLGRKETVPLIPHPVDTDGLKKLYVPPKDRLDAVGVLFHLYDGHLLIPSILSKAAGRTHGKFRSIDVQVPTILFGFLERNIDLSMFDVVATRKAWDQYIYLLSHCTVGLSYYSGVSSQDRFCAETSCLGIPTVTTTNSYFGKLFFPKCSFDPDDFEGMLRTLERLKTDQQYWTRVKEYGWTKVEKYGFKPSVERLLNGMRSWGIKI